jgi:hypothetical protein
MNDLNIIEHAKAVTKTTMLDFLFEPADAATFSAMERKIAEDLIKEDHVGIDFNVEVVLDGKNDVAVKMELFGVGDSGSTKFIARYVDCPVVLEESKEALKAEKTNIVSAYERAMEIV